MIFTLSSSSHLSGCYQTSFFFRVALNGLHHAFYRFFVIALSDSLVIIMRRNIKKFFQLASQCWCINCGVPCWRAENLNIYKLQFIIWRERVQCGECAVWLAMVKSASCRKKKINYHPLRLSSLPHTTRENILSSLKIVCILQKIREKHYLPFSCFIPRKAMKQPKCPKSHQKYTQTEVESSKRFSDFFFCLHSMT